MSLRAVIIGSGMGGLASARLLQQQGYQVTVLEQHYRAGGFLHRFFRQGTAYDTGFHYAGSMHEDQTLARCLRHLGVGGLPWRELDPDGFDELRFPGRTLRIPAGMAAFRERLVEQFPSEAAGIDRYLALVKEASETYALFHLRSGMDVMQVLRWEGITVTEVLQRCVQDPQLQAMLCGQALLYGVLPDEAPFGLHALVTEHFVQGAWSLDGGGDVLAMALVRRIKADGGSIRFRARVERIEVTGRLATGVVLESGERLEADLVISNAHPRATMGLLPEQALRRAYRSRIEGMKPGLAHLGVYLELDTPAPQLARRNLYRFKSWDLPTAVMGTRPGHCDFYFATAPSMHGPSRRGGNPMLVITGLPWEHFAGWRERRDAAYEELKQALLDTVVATVQQDMPEVGIVRSEASTPLTTEHFTLSPEGAMYGNYHSIHQMGRYRVSAQMRVKNVLMVGHGVGMPGIMGVTLSAYHAIGSIVGLDKLVAQVRAA